MTSYDSTISPETFAEALGVADRVGVFTHRKPDGDAMGSVIGLVRALTARGGDAVAHFMGPFESALASLAEPTAWVNVDEQEPADDFDCLVVMDTGAWSQLEPIEPYLKRHRDRVLGLDHHMRGDDVTDRRLVVPSCASTTQALLPVLDALGIKLTAEIATPLFLGLATDTGWFRHDNANADAFAVASRLLAAGVNKAHLYQTIEETHRPARLKIEARVLESIQYHDGGRVAIAAVGPDDFAATGAGSGDLVGVVNHPLIVNSVKVSILMTELEPGLTKISFRAKPAPDGEPEKDVNEFARNFGGGGHRLAAGARIKAPFAEARTQIVRALEA